jgi:two-component system NarL family sensor kinase
MEKWLDAKTIATWIIIAFIVVVTLTVSIVKLAYLNIKRQVENQLRESKLQLAYQHKLIETSITVQERERERIAADLHDALIGKLTTLKLNNHLKYKIEEIDKALDESITEARRISHDLSPPMLEFISPEDIVADVVNEWNGHLNVVYNSNILAVSEPTNELKLQLKRILQELMTNIYKHAAATIVRMHLRISGARLILLVSDNGKGFEMKEGYEGLGLKNIELRVLYLNGKFKIKSGHKGTTSVFVFNV